jgi:MarR family transcriptional regulator, organic hydroperoxide resistance regulator
VNRAGLDACLALHGAHASLQLKLDDELGTLHGLGWSDFALLSALAAAPGERLPLRALMRPVGLPLSGVVRRLAPLEKLGLLSREGGGTASRTIVLQAGGRRLLRESTETAAHVCALALAALPAGAVSRDGLDALADTPALRLS